MAIKGKSKGRSTSRSVARGPKPVYTPVKRPLLQRRGLWIGVAGVLLAAIAVGLFYGFAKQRSEDREAAEAQALSAAAREFGGQVDSLLAQVGQPAPPTGFNAFPQLSTQLDGLDGLDGGDGDGETVADGAQGIADQASSTADAVAAIDVTAIVRDRELDPTFVVYLFDAKDDMVRGLRLYEQAAALIVLAARSEPPVRDDLIGRARDLVAVAGEVFAGGYESYVEAQSRAGVFQPSIPTLPTGVLTGPTAPAGALTGTTGTTGDTTGTS